MYWIILFIQQYFHASTYTPGYDLAHLTLREYNDCNDPKVLYETSDEDECDTFASDLRKYAQVDATTILNAILKEVNAFEPKKEVMHQTIQHLLNEICKRIVANASHEGHEAIKKAYNDAACTAELENVYSVFGHKAVYEIFECSVKDLMIKLADESALECFAISETTMQQKYDVIAKIFCKSIETGIIEVVESNDYQHLKGMVTIIASKGKSGPLFDKLTGLLLSAVSITVKIISSSSKYSQSNGESHEQVLQKATTIDIGNQSTGAGSLFKKLQQKANQVRTNPTNARVHFSKLMSDIIAKITSSMLPEDLEEINNVCDKADSFAELEIIYYAIGQKALTKILLRMFKQSLKDIGVKKNIRNLVAHAIPKEKYQIIGDWLRDLISVSVEKLCDKQEFSDKAYVIKHIAKNATEGEVFDKLTCLAYKAITYLVDIITSSSDYMEIQSFYVGETSTKSSELQNDLSENENAEPMRHKESISNEGTSGNNQMSGPEPAQVGMHYLLNKIESKMLNGLLLTDTDDVLGSYIGKPALSAFYFIYIAIGAAGFEAIISAYNERISKLKMYPFIKQTLSYADIEPKYKMISIALRKAFCNAVLEVVSKPKYRNLCSEIERLANKELTSIMIDAMAAELQVFIAALVEKLQPSSIESEDDTSLELKDEC